MGCDRSFCGIVPLSGTSNTTKGTSVCRRPLDRVWSGDPLVPDYHFEYYCCDRRELVCLAGRAFECISLSTVSERREFFWAGT